MFTKKDVAAFNKIYAKEIAVAKKIMAENKKLKAKLKKRRKK